MESLFRETKSPRTKKVGHFLTEIKKKQNIFFLLSCHVKKNIPYMSLQTNGGHKDINW